MSRIDYLYCVNLEQFTKITMNKNNTLLFITILPLVLLVVMAFSPPIVNNERLYSFVRVGVLGFLMILAFLSKSYRALNNQFILNSLIIAVFSGIIVFFLYAFSFRVGWHDVISLIIVILSISIGYSLSFTDGQIEFTLLVYGALSVVLGVYSMIYYVGAVTLADYMYAVDTKNLVGQIVATAGIGLVVTTLKRHFMLIKIVLIGLIVILLFVLRCKTALVAFFLFAVFYYRHLFKSSSIFVLMVAVAIICVVYYTQIYSFLETVFVGTKDIVDLNDFTSDRLDRNRDGIAFFLSHPFFGELKIESGIQNIHNYVIKRLAGYGLFSLPFIVFYFYYFISFIKQLLSFKNKRMDSTGLLMLIIPFFSSLLEPSAPFGPGLIQTVPFIFYGLYLRYYKASFSE